MNNLIKIVIAGTRTFTDFDYLESKCIEICRQLVSEGYILKKNLEIVSGCARGADKMGEGFALKHHIPFVQFPADWDTYGKRAGYKRNEQMARYAVEDSELGVLIAFWDGESRGTKHMIDLANKYGLRVFVVKYNARKSTSKEESMGDMIAFECGEVPWDYY